MVEMIIDSYLPKAEFTDYYLKIKIIVIKKIIGAVVETLLAKV